MVPVRERAFYAICVVDDDRYFKNKNSFASLQDQQEKFYRRAIYGMIDGSRNNFLLIKKTHNGCVKLKTVVMGLYLHVEWASFEEGDYNRTRFCVSKLFNLKMT